MSQNIDFSQIQYFVTIAIFTVDTMDHAVLICRCSVSKFHLRSKLETRLRVVKFEEPLKSPISSSPKFISLLVQ